MNLGQSNGTNCSEDKSDGCGWKQKTFLLLSSWVLVHAYILSMVDVVGRLGQKRLILDCCCRDGSVGVSSQFSGLTGSMLRYFLLGHRKQ